MSAQTERALRRWRAVLLSVAVVVTVAGGVLLLAALAVRVAPVPLAVWTVVVLLALLASAWVLGRLGSRVPARAVLTLDLGGVQADLPPDDPRGRLGRRDRVGLRDVVETLERAAGDERVAGLWCRTGSPAGGLADVQEVRDAVQGFRAQGKFAVAFAETFGEVRDGTAAYYAATAFEEVTLQPSGDVMLTGLASEVTFVRDALDSLRVTTQFDHRKEYKSARNLMTERRFTPAHREATERIVETAFQQVVEGVAAGRGLEQTEVRALVDRAPLLATEARDAGLVDRLGYRDESIGAALARAGEGARRLTLSDYRRRTRRRPWHEQGRLLATAGTAAPAASGAAFRAPRVTGGSRRGSRKPTTVALVHGVGAVTSGRGRFNPLTTWTMGADTVGRAIRQAVKDGDVQAIVFRVDSPGGSYVASDALWHETERAREAGKPLVVSMGNVAGSGGYFVSMAADRIVAHPATVTGSIGVVGGKAVLAELRSRLGVTRDEAHAGRHALMWSTQYGFSPSEWERFQAWLDRCYEDFTGKVAAGRGLDLEQVHEVARGRVWTGADAVQRGLVDALGGYPRAFAEVRALLDLPDGHPLQIVPFPRRVSPLARLTGRDRQPDDETDLALHAGDLLPAPARVAADLGLAGGDALLLAPEPWGIGVR